MRQKANQKKPRAAVELVEKLIHKTFACYAYPPQHLLKITTNISMERLLKEARRRT